MARSKDWRVMMRESGLDPAIVRPALPGETFEFSIPDDRLFAAECVIGDPTRCTGSKAIKEADPGVVWDWFGASRAVVVFKRDDGSLEGIHYEHSGVVSKMQDDLLMPPPGTYKLRAVPKGERIGKPRKRRKALKPQGNVSQRGRRISTAALLRSGYFNEEE